MQKSISAGPVPPPEERSQFSQTSSPTTTSGTSMATNGLRRRPARISGVSSTNHKHARMYQSPPVNGDRRGAAGRVEEREDPEDEVGDVERVLVGRPCPSPARA